MYVLIILHSLLLNVSCAYELRSSKYTLTCSIIDSDHELHNYAVCFFPMPACKITKKKKKWLAHLNTE